MKRSDKMQPFLKLTKYREKIRAAHFSDKQSQMKTYQEQLKLMENYRAEYINHVHADEAISVQHLSERQAFVHQINQTIEVLKQQIKLAQPGYNADKESWMRSRQMMKSVETVIDRAKQQEDREEQQLEQSILDEIRNKPQGL